MTFISGGRSILQRKTRQPYYTGEKKSSFSVNNRKIGAARDLRLSRSSWMERWGKKRDNIF